MWEEVIRQAAANGLWAVMFCVLLVHQLKESRAREQRYQETVKSLAKSLSAVEEIKQDVAGIKEIVGRDGRRNKAAGNLKEVPCVAVRGRTAATDKAGAGGV